MKAEDRIARQMLKILNPRNGDVFWGGILVQLNRESKPDEWFQEQGTPPTMCVDGVTLRYADSFVDSISDAELHAVLIHEAMHIVLGHCLQMAVATKRNGGKLPYHPVYRNVSDDLAINSILRAESIPIGENCLYPGQAGKPWHDWPDLEGTDYYYNRLNPPPPPPDGGSSGNCGDGSGTPQAVADYTPSATALPQPAVTDEEISKAQRQLESDIAGSAISAKAAGNLPAGIQQLVDHLIPKPPKVDWRSKLHGIAVNAIREKRTFGKMSRRWPTGLPGGIMVPGKGGKGPGRILFATDTSGSMSDDDCNKAVAELEKILSICDSGEVRIVQFDTEITSDCVYTAQNLPISEKWELKGRGGTAFAPVFDLVRQYKPTLLVMLTDGYPCDPWPTKLQCPTVFLLTSGIKEAPIGKSIVLED